MNKSPKYYLKTKVHEFPKARFNSIKWVKNHNKQNMRFRENVKISSN